MEKLSFEYVNKIFKKLSERIEELFQSVSNGKALVASAITDKGVSTAQDDTFSQMATNIRAIQTGSTGITPSGTKDITVNGEYDVTSYAKANVNVPIPSGYIKPSGTKPVTENGTYDVSSYASVEVSVKNISGSGSTDGKVFRYTHPAREVTSKWVTLVGADADVLAHKDDTKLCVSFYGVTPPSGVAALLGGIASTKPMAADGKYGVCVRQTSANAQSPSSLSTGLRNASASGGVLRVTDNGEIQVYQASGYPLGVSEFVVSVMW